MYKSLTTRSHTCAYVTRTKDNVSRSFEMRSVIHDTRISSEQWPRCDVTNGTCGSRDFQGHTKKAPNKTYTCQNKTKWSYRVPGNALTPTPTPSLKYHLLRWPKHFISPLTFDRNDRGSKFLRRQHWHYGSSPTPNACNSVIELPACWPTLQDGTPRGTPCLQLLWLRFRPYSTDLTVQTLQ
jgi:hypothetical protein